LRLPTVCVSSGSPNHLLQKYSNRMPNLAEGISKGLSGAVFGTLLFLSSFSCHSSITKDMSHREDTHEL
jgi:hypothetical protein